ncbi:alkyl/aryl-sulfatase [Neobacillus cucumis]|uniref:alkyl/aryl-sulfatase n=1 Tax=Neobacillus cucumis TaxID=1740721 RepID=UPI002E24B0DA|nr:alkyl sulfatase dimerization domain-containing protein [Neobacillus cucumis]MED4224413.1 alkyl sulfatase dimerization domain-containing protein [Neobacillus cucumis]
MPFSPKINGLDDIRKPATSRTQLINKDFYHDIEWGKLEIEKVLVKENLLVNVPFPVIEGKNTALPVWDLSRYAFLLTEQTPDTVHPKLWEQAKLNLQSGLYRITDNIYQVRGFDIANISFIKGKTGWIVVDCLTSKETAKAALQVMQKYFGDFSVSAIIITHSHADHYGGIYGILEASKDKSLKIYVPKNFMKYVIEENITAAVAMNRRGVFMFGALLPHDDKGHIDNGIGKALSTGTVTLSRNVQEISQPNHGPYIEKIIDGVSLQFQLTPGTEAPAEMNIYVPSEKSLCIAENCSATLHNLYTLRGAQVRDPIAWASYLQQAIDLFGADLSSIFGAHNWARFENTNCLHYLEKQRDMYQYLNDQTLRLINQGYTLEEVGRMVQFPKSLSDEWYTSSFYGTVNHNAKAVYQKYMGWYNGNPVDLNKLLPEDSARKYVEYMGGEVAVLEKAKRSFQNGEYQWVAEVTKQVIYFNPNNIEAKVLCADALEQLGYMAESGPWRNEYLMGAQELRFGIRQIPISTITKEVLDALPLQSILYLLSIRVDGLLAGDFDYKINFVIPDRKEVASTEIKRGIFRYLKDELVSGADVSVTMWKDGFYKLVTTNHQSNDSIVIIQGDKNKWQSFLRVLDKIDPNFNIMTPKDN